MLRTLLVVGVLVLGIWRSRKGPFHLLLLYLWLAYFRPEEWVWSDFITPLRLSYWIGLSLLISVVLSSKERFTWGLGPTLLLAFLIHSLLSTVQSDVAAYSWLYWQEFAKILTIGYLMIVMVRDQERFRWVLATIAISLGFEGAKQGWVQFLRNPGAVNTNTSGFLGDNNGVAIGMLVTFSFLVALVKTSSWRFEKLTERFLAFGVLYRAVSTYSRGGMLALVAWTMLHVWRSKRRLVGMIAIVVTGAAITTVLPDRFWDRMGTLRTAAEGDLAVDESAAGRLYFWSVARRMAADHPVFGIGHNAYRAQYDRYDVSDGQWGRGRSVHSLWFGLLAELGYVGVGLFVVIWLYSMWVCQRSRRLAKGKPELANIVIYASALEGGLVICAVAGTFYPFQYNEMLWHLLILAMVLDGLARQPVAMAPVAAAPLSPLPTSGGRAGALNPGHRLFRGPAPPVGRSNPPAGR